jgi:hypothetical protein
MRPSAAVWDWRSRSAAPNPKLTYVSRSLDRALQRALLATALVAAGVDPEQEEGQGPQTPAALGRRAALAATSEGLDCSRALRPQAQDRVVDLILDPSKRYDAEHASALPDQVAELLLASDHDRAAVGQQQVGGGDVVTVPAQEGDGLSHGPQGDPRIEEILDELELEDIGVGVPPLGARRGADGGADEVETGELSFGGWIWRYDLEATGPSRTTVTLTYDWSAVPPQVRAYLKFLPFGQDHLDNSLQHLSDLVVGACDVTVGFPTCRPERDSASGQSTRPAKRHSVQRSCSASATMMPSGPRR